MASEKKQTPFTVPFILNPEVASEMLSRVATLNQLENQRKRWEKIINSEIEELYGTSKKDDQFHRSIQR
jgi:hypothetical protein